MKKKFSIRYPQESPLSITLNNPLKKENIILNFYLLVQRGKKFRKLAKGEINIYKRYFFINENLSFEKYIYLFTYRNQMNINILKDTKKDIYPGKIFIKGQFIDLIESRDTDISLALKNLEENTRIIKSALNSISPKEKEKYFYSLNNKIKNGINIENNGLELDTLNCKLDEEDELKLISENIQNPRKEIDEDLSDISLSIDSPDEDDNDTNSQNIEQVQIHKILNK